MNKPKKPYAGVSNAQLAEATAELSAGAIPAPEPLSAGERARWERAAAGGSVSVRVGPGRPKVGEGSVVVPVSLEAGLLRRVVAFARDAGIKRSEIVARALELLVDGATEIAGKKVTRRKSGTDAKNGLKKRTTMSRV